MPAKKVSSASKGSDTDTRLMASGFITAMKAPSSTKEQKEALKFYQDLPRFSDIKKDILLKWKQDRTCAWLGSRASKKFMSRRLSRQMNVHRAMALCLSLLHFQIIWFDVFLCS